jgi:hypothetical protein
MPFIAAAYLLIFEDCACPRRIDPSSLAASHLSGKGIVISCKKMNSKPTFLQNGLKK